MNRKYISDFEFMLVDTLNELLKQARKRKIPPTILLLECNKSITHEIVEASETHNLDEYLGLTLHKKARRAHKR